MSTPRLPVIEGRLRQALALLQEHVDSVAIVVTFPNGDGSYGARRACAGNWYACVASVREFEMQREDVMRADVIPDVNGGAEEQGAA